MRHKFIRPDAKINTANVAVDRLYEITNAKKKMLIEAMKLERNLNI